MNVKEKTKVLADEILTPNDVPGSEMKDALAGRNDGECFNQAYHQFLSTFLPRGPVRIISF